MEQENQITKQISIRKSTFINTNQGTVQDNYDIGGQLGEGTYGCVRHAVHIATGAPRAIKVIPKPKIKNWKRFTTECQILKNVDHPNVIKLYEIFEDARNVYFVMELCTGGELFDRIINTGNFNEKDAAMIFKQILSALFYCHKNKICHRDLKPENFLFQNEDIRSTLKVIDFGLSKIWGEEEGKNFKTKAGTPYYISPDVLKGVYTESCDVWSAGVILYTLLCGYPPFYGASDAQILERVKKGRYSFRGEAWADVSSEAKDLISLMLRMNPEERPTAEQALTHPWIVETAPNSTGAILTANLSNIKQFLKTEQLKKATLNFIASQLQDNEIGPLKDLFLEIDKNKDGTLTLSELKESLIQFDTRLASRMEQLFQNMDVDGSGTIDYTEFLAASMERSTYLQEEKLWSAFRMFDKDGSGKISAEELKQVLGIGNIQGLKDQAVWDDIIKEVDYNGDGEVDFDEFLKMMYKRAPTN